MEDDDLGLGLSDDDEPVVSAPAKVAPALTGPGIVSTAKPKELRAEERKHNVVLKASADAKRTLLEKEFIAKEAASNLEKAQAAMDELRKQESALIGKIARVQASPLLAVQKKREITSLNEQLQTVADRIILQAQTMDLELKAKYAAEGERDEAEFLHARLWEARVSAQEAKKAVQSELESVAEERVRKEQRGVEKLHAKHTQRIEHAKSSFETATAVADYKAEAAKALHAQAKVRAASADQKMALVRETAEALAKERREKRVKSVLSLKANVDAATSEIKGANEKAAKAAAKKAKAQAAEKDAILADGGNPYEVFRRRDMDASVAKQLATKQAAVQEAKLALTAGIIKEDEGARQAEEKERGHVEALKAYKASLSRANREAKVSDYISSKTQSGEDVLDPTGRQFKVLPSQVTTIRDHSFGLGKSRPDILEMMASKPEHKKVTIDPRWIPKPVDESVRLETSPIRTGTGRGTASLSGSVPDYGDTREIPGEPDRTERLKPRAPSKLEQRIMADALQRQRDGITKTQVVLGREYKGSGFAASPSTVDFVDFDVGVPMTRRFILTNVSLTFNSFKILPLPPSIRDFFDISFTPPGRMSAGLTCSITVRFSPKTREDIHDHISVLAHTGPVEIPLNCTSKKALPVIQASVVDVGTVTMGETGTSYVVLENKGALAVHVTMALAEFDDDGPASGLAQALSFQAQGDLQPYSKLSLPVTFKPMAEGWLETALEVSYDDPSCRPQQILVKANAIPPPIFVEQAVIDFESCVYDKLYRAVLSVRNRGTTALKCLTTVPPAMRGLLEFVPDMFFLQAKEKGGDDGKTDVVMKFRPSSGCLDRPALAEYIQEGGASIRVPLSLSSPDQVLPVEFELVARLTQGDLTWEPAAVDFGKCFTSQSSKVSLTVTNTSELPQKFGFVSLPSEIRVVPNQGLGTVLPNESVTFNIVYSPTAATDLSTSISLTTTINKTYRIPVSGCGVISPLRLSHSLIKFGAGVVGETLTSSVYLTNTSSEPVSFEWIPLPKVSSLTVSPLVSTLSAGEACRVELTFVPSPEEDSKFTEDIPAAVGSIVYSQSVRASEPWSKHGRWTIPCFIRPFKASGSDSKEMEQVTLSDSLALEVHTTTTKTALRLENSRVSFGQVAVGTVQIAKVRVWNDSTRDSELLLAGLNPSGSFSFLNAPRTIGHGQYQDLVVQFRPLSGKRFVETATVSASHRGAALECVLSGEGVSPSLTLSPADGLLDLGNVMAGDTSTATAKLTNTSAFPLSFTIRSVGRPYSNHNGSAVVVCSPQQGRLEPGAETALRITFAPDHVSRKEFLTRFDVIVPNQTSDMQLVVKGRSWARQAYALPASVLDAPADHPSFVESSTLLPIDVTDDTGASGVGDGGEVPYELVLEFPKLTPEECSSAPATGPTAGLVVVTKQVLLGSCGRVTGKESSPTGFEVILPTTAPTGLFAVDTAKGSVPPGGSQKLTFKVTRPKPPSAEGSGAALDVGQWAEAVAKINVTGGAKCAGVPDKQTIAVRLRAFVVN